MAIIEAPYNLQSITYPLATTEENGHYPDIEAVIRAEIERIFDELKTNSKADDQRIIDFFQAQLTQLNAIVNGLAGGAELQQALETLQNIKGIVDKDGNGILDAVGPLNTSINDLSSRVTALEETVGQVQTYQNILGPQTANLDSRLQTTQQDLNVLRNLGAERESAITSLGKNLSHNLQAIRDGLKAVNVDYQPIALPDPVFATTNVANTGGSAGDNPTDPADLE